jgi:hypothetical protein
MTIEEKGYPPCYADYQFNHAHDRQCVWCEVKTDCKTGEPAKEKPMAWKHYTKPLERRLQHLEAKEHQNSFDKHEASALKHVLEIVKQPQPRTWVGLTPEERSNCRYWACEDFETFGRAIEAKLKEKNND